MFTSFNSLCSLIVSPRQAPNCDAQMKAMATTAFGNIENKTKRKALTLISDVIYYQIKPNRILHRITVSAFGTFECQCVVAQLLLHCISKWFIVRSSEFALVAFFMLSFLYF